MKLPSLKPLSGITASVLLFGSAAWLDLRAQDNEDTNAVTANEPDVQTPNITLEGVAAPSEFDRRQFGGVHRTSPNVAKRSANEEAAARMAAGTKVRRGLTLGGVATVSTSDRDTFEQAVNLHRAPTGIALEEATYSPAEAQAARGGRPGGEGAITPGAEGEAIEPDSWFQEEFLTGSWWGYRPKLQEAGFEVNASWTADFLGNVTGGRSTGFEPAASLGITLDFDMEKLAGIKGGEFVTGCIWRTGDNLSGNYIDNLLTAAQLYGGQNLRLMYLYWAQSLLEDQLYFKVGRFAAFDDFLADPMNWNYVNNGFDGNVKGVFFQVPPFGNTVYPTSSWGAFGKWQTPDKELYVQSGIYGISSKNGQNSTSGLNFTFDFDQGAAIFTQLGWLPNNKPNDPDLPGRYRVGCFVSTGDFKTFDVPQEEANTNAGFYWMFQHMLYREPGAENLALIPNHYGPDGQNGLYLWTQGVYTPDANLAQFNFYQNVGLLYQGPIPGRPQDFAAFGWGWIQAGPQQQNFQRAMGQPVQDFEMVLEWNYRWQLTRYFYIQPDIQYIIDPGAAGLYDNALVLGAQVGVVF